MSNPGEGSQNPPEPPLDIEDPRLVDVIVEDLKSQGVFDKIRAECIGEVDTKVSQCLGNKHSFIRFRLCQHALAIGQSDSHSVIDACFMSFLRTITFMTIPSAIAARVPEPEKPRGELGLSRPRQAELEADAEQEPAAQPDQEADAGVSQSLSLVNFSHLGSWNTVALLANLHSCSQRDLYGRRRRAHRGPGGEPEDPVARGAGSQEDHQRLPRRRRDHGRRR